jgi:hypothetical protein
LHMYARIAGTADVILKRLLLQCRSALCGAAVCFGKQTVCLSVQPVAFFGQNMESIWVGHCLRISII